MHGPIYYLTLEVSIYMCNSIEMQFEEGIPRSSTTDTMLTENHYEIDNEGGFDAKDGEKGHYEAVLEENV